MIVAVWSQANDISENQVGCSKKKKIFWIPLHNVWVLRNIFSYLNFKTNISLIYFPMKQGMRDLRNT